MATNLSKGRSDEELGELVGESKDQIRRHIRLTELVPEILQMVDERQIAFRPAVEVSYLTEEQQYILLEAMEYNDATPSLAQAIKMKKYNQDGNRSCECMEIEAVSYYSLKQVYAARMLLFGVTDIFFITLFLGAASAGLHYELSELVVQFLFPLCVTACICFGILCSKRSFSETVAIVLCVIWSALWLFIVLNENIYVMVTVPIWLMLFGLAMIFLGFAIYRILKNCNQYLEVSFYEIRT